MTATATDAAGNTSEFSQCITVTQGPTPTFTVNTTDDTNDGSCTTVHCSLREAINRSNAVTGVDTIAFDIPGSGPHTISPTTQLPIVTDPAVIDGTTEPSFTNCSAGPAIELDGTNAVGPDTFVAGLKVTAGSSTIRGLVINRFSGDGLLLTVNGGNVVQCNWIGTDVTGALARPNGFRGVAVDTPNNTIGGASASARNVLSGNTDDAGIWLAGPDATGNIVKGNFVGTDATGTADLGNIYGIYVFAELGANQIGGSGAGEGNVVSGNQLGIILQDSDDNVVEGNRIGLAATGSGSIGNTSHGIWIQGDSTGNTIGGTSAGAGNLIVANNDGVNVEPMASSIPEGNSIVGNSIHGNFGLGIDLDPNGVTPNDAGDGDSGANRRMNFPTITYATPGAPGAITGTLDSAPGSYRIEFFVSPSCDPSGNGEGQQYLGAVNAPSDSTFTFNSALTLGDVVTATATDSAGNTSEFSACTTVAPSSITPCGPNPSNPILVGNVPANLRLDGQPPVASRPAYEDDACLYLFEERQHVALPQTIHPVAPSASNMAAGTGPTRELPAGTIVSSFLLHGDRVGSPAAGVTISGTWTFAEPILAISVKSEGLIRTDSMTGLANLSYEIASGNAGPRGMEPDDNDLVFVDPDDPYTVHVRFVFNAMDEIRVFTGFVDPHPVCNPAPSNPILVGNVPANLRLDGQPPVASRPAYEDDACLYLFEERQHVALPQTIHPVAPSASNMAAGTGPTRELPAGTIVSSFLLHGDRVGSPAAGVTISGTWTFAEPILAISVKSEGLIRTDSMTGLANLSYEIASGNAGPRGMEPDDNDLVFVDPDDPYTVHVRFVFNAMDEIRVFTGFVTPAQKIVVLKDAAPNSSQDFDFTTTGLDLATFSLDDDADPTLSNGIVFWVRPGTGYAIAEAPVPGWDLAHSGCDDGSPVSNIAVSANEVVTCTFTNAKRGQIIIRKETNPDGDTDVFEFNPSWTANFFLSDGESEASPLLEPNLYSVSELPAPGWTASAVCDDGSQINGIVVSPGEIVTCTVTNTRNTGGRIVVDKVTRPSGSSQAFGFNLTGGPGSVSRSFSLGDSTTPYDSGVLQPGTYAVAEAPVGGWDLAIASCDDGSTPDAISLSSGEVVTCTFTNDRRGTIVIQKETDPDGSAAIFEFDPSWGPNFFLSDGGSIGPTELAAGVYSVSEVAAADWTPSASCSDDSPVNAIGLSPGETVTCTFTNRHARGHIIVTKETDPNGAPESFLFTANFDSDGFSLADGESEDSGELLAGTYSVSETPLAGWDLTVATCDDGSPPGEIALSPGETVTCAFTNAKRGRIVIQKETDPDGAADSFEFDPSWGPNFFLSDGQSTFADLPSGTYSVTELPSGDWAPSAICSDGSSINAIGVSAGEIVTCTITNRHARGHIIVTKQTDPDGAPDVFAFTASYDGDGFMLSDGQSNDSGELVAGTTTLSVNRHSVAGT